MTSKADILLDTILLRWGKTSLRFPKLVLLIFLSLSASSLYYTFNNLGVNTDTTQMLASDLPFQQMRRKVEEIFPQDSEILLILIDASTPEQAKAATLDLGRRLAAEKGAVQSLYIPGEGTFFDKQGLLYLDADDLDALATHLARAQPFIGKLADDYSLAGLFSILGSAIGQTDDSLPLEINPLLLKVSTGIKASSENSYYQLSWQQLMYGSDRVSNRRLILLKPILDFSEIMAAEKSFVTIKKIVGEVQSFYPELTVRITGEIALEFEELESVAHSAVWAGIFSLILVCASLLFGLGSVKLMLATLLTLIIGLILTAGFATLAVGHLNLISIAFAVLYIGLGVDYAIHLCLRYRDFVQEKMPNAKALTESIRSVGPSIILCAVSTAIGLYAFIPTDYIGVSELGTIAGTGMFIGLVVTLSVLPAIFSLSPLSTPKPLGGYLPEWFYNIPFKYASVIKPFSIILVVLVPLFLFDVEFDSNPINMRDPNTESVSTFKELLKSTSESPFVLTMLATDAKSAMVFAKQLEELSTVKSAVTIFDFVPDDQDKKLAIIEDLDFILGSQLRVFDKSPEGGKNRQALENFLAKINHLIKEKGASANPTLLTIKDELSRLLGMIDNQPVREPELLSRLETSLLGSLPTSLAAIDRGLQASPFTLVDIPKALLQRWVSKDGVYRIQINPKKDLNDPANLKEFVDQVQSIDENVAGLPVGDQASGKAVVLAFQQAFIGALLAIALLLVIILRSIKDASLVLFLLILVGSLTGMATVVLDSPFNFANIIALPLLLGLGVDSCIHVVHRARNLSTVNRNPLRTSTARGVVFSSLTTLFSFSSLAFTPHLGTASMGLLLTIGILFTLFSTLLILPAFIGSANKLRSNRSF